MTQRSIARYETGTRSCATEIRSQTTAFSLTVYRVRSSISITHIPGQRLEDFGYAHGCGSTLETTISQPRHQDNAWRLLQGLRVVVPTMRFPLSLQRKKPWPGEPRPAHVSEWVKFVHEWSTNCRAWVELNRTNLWVQRWRGPTTSGPGPSSPYGGNVTRCCTSRRGD
jgi:hypothetical protein